jgi:hypothetical protein
MRMHAVVMLEPRIELAQHTGRVGPRADPRVIPLEGFDEGFSHAVIRHDDFRRPVFALSLGKGLW